MQLLTRLPEYRSSFRAAVVLTVLLFAGCSAEMPHGAFSREIARSGITATVEPRKIAYSASLTLEVVDSAAVDQPVRKITEQAGGYLANAYASDKHYNATLRIPSARLEEVIAELSDLGEVESKQITAEDVTDQVTDTEAEMKSLTALRDRYREVLSKANDLKDVLAIEGELNRIQKEIDLRQGLLGSLEKRVAYSQLSLDCSERTIYGPVGLVLHGLYWAVEKLFVIQ